LSESESGPSNPISEQATHVAGLVEYQQGSVVTRTLVDTASTTVTLFAFDEGEGLSEHTAPFDALIYGVEGEAQVTVSGIEHRLSEGHVLLMPANEPHALRAATRFRMLLVMART